MKRLLSLAVAAGLLAGTAAQADVTLLNASYDPTRELYKDLGAAFAAVYKTDKVIVKTSNAGSGAQARAVIDGLKAVNPGPLKTESVAPIWRPSVNTMDAGPSHGSNMAAWYS